MSNDNTEAQIEAANVLTEDDEPAELTDEQKRANVAKLDRKFIHNNDENAPRVSVRAQTIAALRAERRNLSRRPDDDSVHGRSKARRLADVEAELALYGDEPPKRTGRGARAGGAETA